MKADLSVALKRVGSFAAFSESFLTDVGSMPTLLILFLGGINVYKNNA